MRWAVLDELITAATMDQADVLKARAEWSQHTGPIHEDHELYTERSDAFVEWYVLERKGADGKAPVERLLKQDPCPFRPEDRPVVEALSRSYRSLFEVKKMRPGCVTIDDLLAGERFEVDERRKLPGVASGDIFEARLLPDPEDPYKLLFAKTFLFHPREARRAVKDHVTRSRQNGESKDVVLFRLQRLRLRSVSYRHVPAQRIYAQPDAPF